MIKGIYISQDLSHAGGIQDKIYKQIKEFQDHGFEITPHINPKRNIFHLISNVIPFFSVQYFNTENIEWRKYNFIYIRKGAIFDKSVIKMLKRAKKENPDVLVILEIPTYPYINEFKGWLKKDVQLKEKKWVLYLKEYVNKVVTYSDDKEIYGIPCLNISNAYNFVELPQVVESNSDEIRLLGVAALCFYHGYDRVIEGLKNYYADKDNIRKVYFTLVGDGPVLESYRQKVSKYCLEEYISFPGRKKFNELGTYYEKADIGVDSLARHRSGVSYNSSLKGKEYLANGLPIISGVKTDLDEKNFEYYYRVPPDDSPIDIVNVINWYDEIRKGKTKSAVANSIFQYGRSHFTFKETFKSIVSYIEGEVNERSN